jgi:hypothetical protein
VKILTGLNNSFSTAPDKMLETAGIGISVTQRGSPLHLLVALSLPQAVHWFKAELSSRSMVSV